MRSMSSYWFPGRSVKELIFTSLNLLSRERAAESANTGGSSSGTTTVISSGEVSWFVSFSTNYCILLERDKAIIIRQSENTYDTGILRHLCNQWRVSMLRLLTTSTFSGCSKT
jgi:hypothetical protein